MLSRMRFTPLLAVLVTAILSLASHAAPPAGASAVEVVDKAGYEKILARHKGKVILVDCWATWCVPCIKAFPKTVELSERYRKDGLAVVSLSFDSLKKGEAPPSVVEFLKDK
ncbi:MAG TPA: TlpA disulfide reductase family protein, partial [Planctomycetaceae bacterium]|nr:TlpA disulfide reductase family protein [Planctomycetaceae bacterium]